MLGRILWLATLAVIAVLAVGLEFDREARKEPRFTAAVPAPFRGFAQSHMTSALLAGGGSDRALAEAETLVRRRPVPAEHLSMLSAAAATVPGRSDLATSAIIAAGQRGWRDGLSQVMIANASMAANEWDTAADRISALWAAGRSGQYVDTVTKAVLADERGRKAFARRLSEDGEGWKSQFLSWARTNLNARELGALLSMTTDIKLDCTALARTSARAAEAGDPDAARAIWTGICAQDAARRSGTDGLGNSFAFPIVDLGEGAGPFAWSFPNRGDVVRDVRKAAGGTALDFTSREPGRVVVARRVATLAPGAHTLTLRSSSSTSTLVLQGVCVSPDGQSRRLPDVEDGAEPRVLTVPASGCPVQVFRLLATRGEGSGVRIEQR